MSQPKEVVEVMGVSEDERAIRELVDEWLRATSAGDGEKVLSLMTDDAIFMVPGGEPFGKAEFAATFEGMKDARINGTSEIREIQVLGDWAYVRNYMEMSMQASGYGTTQRKGYALTLFRKEPDGHWKLARDANLLTEV